VLHHNNTPTHSFPTNYSSLSRKAEHIHPTTTLFATSRTNRVLLVPEVEIHTERSISERDDINENSMSKLNNIPQKLSQQCSQKQRKHWERCIMSAGNYFEGDKAE
jgi:hypothetical protein